jgi:hypothetical protein
MSNFLVCFLFQSLMRFTNLHPQLDKFFRVYLATRLRLKSFCALIYYFGNYCVHIILDDLKWCTQEATSLLSCATNKWKQYSCDKWSS